MSKSRVFVVALLFVGVGYGGFLTYNSPPLELRRVEVAGNQSVTASEVASSSHLVRGTHLLQISTRSVARRVETIPWVRKARIERVLPSTVRITVSEREPAVIVEVDGRSFLCDREGVLIAEQERDLIRIVDLPVDDPNPGFRIRARQLEHAFNVIDSLDPSLLAEVRSISAASVDRIALHLKGGTLVLYGASEDNAEKNHAIDKLMARYSAEGKKIQQIDVRVPSRPAVKLS